MDTKINLESLLPPTGASVTAPPANGNGSFAQTFLQQLKGMPDTPGGDVGIQTPQIPGIDSLIKNLLAKLTDASSPAKSDKSLNIASDTPARNASAPDTSAINPLIAALLNVIPPAQLQPIEQTSVASGNETQAAPQLGVGVTGSSADTAHALQQVLATLAQTAGAGDMTKNPKPVVGQKGLPVAAPPEVTVTPKPITSTIDPTPKPITPSIDPTPKPITPAEVQSTTFIPPSRPDGVMTPATPKPPDSKTVAAGQVGAVSPLSGKTTGVQDASQTAVQPASQNTDPKNHAETSSQSNTGQNPSDSESKKKSPDADQFSAMPVQTSDSQHTQTGNITMLSQPGAQNSLQNQHSTTATSSGPSTPNVIAANDTAAPRIVHEARLMQAAGQAEMQVSMRSESAGTVSVKAILEGSHLSATVSSPSVETRDWLVNNLHELHAGLSRDDLNLRSFQVSDPGLQGGWNGQDARQQESQEQYRSSAYSGGSQRSAEEAVSGTDLSSLDLNETASQALSLHA